MNNRRRTLLAVAMLTLFALLSTARTAMQSIAAAQRSDEISTFEQQMRQIRSFLPRQGTIGYISNISNPSTFFKAYLLTQYTLSPLIVVSVGDEPAYTPFTMRQAQPASTHYTVIIGVFPDGNPSELLAARQLEIIRQFDNGVVLLRQKE